jgi:cytoskeleton protein RodZ
MTDNQPDNAQDSAGDNTPGNTGEQQPVSAGAALREARERMGLSVADVAHRLKFAPRQVEALEADDFARLPEIAFVRGFVRNYARLLQLDPAPLLAALPGTPAPPPLAARAQEGTPFPTASPPRKSNLVWLAAAALIVVLAAGFFIWSHSGKPDAPQTVREEAAPVPAQPPATTTPAPAVPAPAIPAQVIPAPTRSIPAIPAPAVSAPLSATPPQAAAKPAPQITAPSPPSGVVAATPKRPGVIRMEFDEESWVEVTDRDGRVLLSKVFPRGSEQSLNGKAPFSLAIGRGSAVRLTYKGKAVDLAPHAKSGVARLTLE